MDTKYISLVLLILLVTIIIVLKYSKNIVNYVEEKFVEDCPTVEEVRKLYLDQKKKNHEGSYKLTEKSSCMPACPPGNFINVNNAYQCDQCDFGEFNEEKNNFNCKTCGNDDNNFRKLTFKKGTTTGEGCKNKLEIRQKIKNDIGSGRELDAFYEMILDNIVSDDHKLKKDDVVGLGKTLILDRALQLEYLEKKMKSLENKLSDKFPSLKF